MSTSDLERTESPTLGHIEEIVRDLLDNPGIVLTADTRPSDIEGWDSLANISIVFGLEEGSGVCLGDDAMAGFETVGDLVRLVDEARRRRLA